MSINIISKCHQNGTKGKIKTATNLAVERFCLVEMKGIELFVVCSPVVIMSVFSGLSYTQVGVCPPIMDLLAPKVSPRVRSITLAASFSSPS